MLQKVGQLVAAAVAMAMLVLGGVLLAGGSAYAQKGAVASVSTRVDAKPAPCTRCCLKMNPKTHRCAKYGYKKGKGKCQAKCK
ncbi:hypothetical protein [Actinoallomurus sp. NPDC052274]|uniref:hypothetical protein n=1 Tax=Actinoallomurus sp. NPDC052274 TaxID=3155420 RepID=UPI0034370CEF